jgi:hypothetical protein
LDAVVRWKSAPVRAAEGKTGAAAPKVDDAYYAIAVYGTQVPKRWNLASDLKGIAYGWPRWCICFDIPWKLRGGTGTLNS